MPEAKANTRAAQMLAEMLAIVCQPEYYQQGEQTVTLWKGCLSDWRLLLSTSPVLKRRFTGQPSLPLSSAKFIRGVSKIPWNHSKSNTLDLVISSIPTLAQLLSSILSHSSAMSQMDMPMSVSYADLGPSFIWLWNPGTVRMEMRLWKPRKRLWMITNWPIGSRIPLNYMDRESEMRCELGQYWWDEIT